MLLVPSLVVRQLNVHFFRAAPTALAPEPILPVTAAAFLRTGGRGLHYSDRVASLDKLGSRTARVLAGLVVGIRRIYPFLMAEDELAAVTVVSARFLGRLSLIVVRYGIKVVIYVFKLLLVIKLAVALPVQLTAESERHQSIIEREREISY